MIRQYFAHRRRGGCNPLGVGVIPVGAIFYIQDEGWWRDRYRGAPICRDPWIVEAFLNGTLAAAHRDADSGRWEDLYLAGRPIRPLSDRCATAAAGSPFVSSSSMRSMAWPRNPAPTRTCRTYGSTASARGPSSLSDLNTARLFGLESAR